MRIPLLQSALLWRCRSVPCQVIGQTFILRQTSLQRPSVVIRTLCSRVTNNDESPEFDKKPKIKKTVHNIVDYISSKVSVKVDSENTISVVSYLIKESIPPQHIAEGLRTNNQLLGFDCERWENAVTILKNYGFKNPQIMPVLHSHHDLFDGNTKQLYSIGESLRYIGYHDGALQKLVCKDPTLLELHPADIDQQFSKLRENFKAVEIIAMALESPSMLYEDYAQLSRKITYLRDTMGIDYDIIAKCYVLGFPYLRIKARHLFLERAGLYRKPDPKKVINYENPSLSKMVRFTDKRFAKKIAGMTELEYKTFEKMIALEEQEGQSVQTVHQLGEESYRGNDLDFDDEEDSDDEIDPRDNYKKKNW